MGMIIIIIIIKANLTPVITSFVVVIAIARKNLESIFCDINTIAFVFKML